MELNFFDKLLLNILSNYTYKIYKIGLKDGFDWYNCPLTVRIKNINKNSL